MADTSQFDPRVQAEGLRIQRDIPLEVIADRRFVGEDVYLDGRSYLRCTFERCRLHIAFGWFALDATGIDDCTIVLQGFAENTRNFVNAIPPPRGQQH